MEKKFLVWWSPTEIDHARNCKENKENLMNFKT